MNGIESSSITWLKEDPFPQLKKRDLLMAAAQVVVGGMPASESNLLPMRVTQPEKDFLLSCLVFTDRTDTVYATALPNRYYANYWAQVSLALRHHSLEGRLGHSLPEPASKEFYEEQFLSETPSPIDETTLNEVADCISRDEFGRVLDIISDHCEEQISALIDPVPTLYDAIDEVRQARADAILVLYAIEQFTISDQSPT